jgi:colanic acid biosynthesis glycosyl transferase WcaI
LCRLVREKQLSNIRLLEKQPRERIPAFLATSDASLIPLKNKSVFKTAIPSKLFEAMAAGKPAILGVEGEAKEILLNSGAGLAVTPEDPLAMASAILRLKEDPYLSRALGQNGRQAVLQKYLRPRQAAEYLSLLNELGERSSFRASGTGHRGQTAEVTSP